jgi:hypothetical protein
MIVNLTPHPVTLVGDGGLTTILPSGKVARVATTEAEVGNVEVNGVVVPLVTTTYGKVMLDSVMADKELPDPAENTWYIVSRVVRSACPDRNDLLVPTRFTRDQAGNIIAAHALSLD